MTMRYVPIPHVMKLRVQDVHDSVKVTIDTRERGLASILVTKIGTPSKLARIVFAALMEQ